MASRSPTRWEKRRLVALGFGIGLLTVVAAGYLWLALIGVRPAVRGVRVTPRLFAFLDGDGEPIPMSAKRLAEIAGYPIAPAGHPVADLERWVAAAMVPPAAPSAPPRSALLVCDPAVAGSCVVHVLDEGTVVLQRHPLPLPAPEAPEGEVAWRPVSVAGTGNARLQITAVLADAAGQRFHVAVLRLDGRAWSVVRSSYGDQSVVGAPLASQARAHATQSAISAKVPTSMITR